MCTEAIVIMDGKKTYCDSVGELASALGVDPRLVSNDAIDCCLCNANWADLGARLATADEGFPWPEYVIERPNVAVEKLPAAYHSPCPPQSGK